MFCSGKRATRQTIRASRYKKWKNNIGLTYCQQVGRKFTGGANLDSMDSGALKLFLENIGIVGAAKNEESTRSLGIKQNILDIRRDGTGDAELGSEKLAIICKSAGAEALMAVFDHPRQKRKLPVIDLNGDTACLGDFQRVTGESKTGDIGHGIDSEFKTDLRCAAVELRHCMDGRLHMVR